MKQGDIRAHPIWGAEVLKHVSSDEEIEVGYKALQASGYDTEFARLDMIPTENGPIVIEVELIDPVMFFDIHPKTAEAYADHIENFLNR